MENIILNREKCIKKKIKELEQIEIDELKITKKKLRFYEFADFLNVSD